LLRVAFQKFLILLHKFFRGYLNGFLFFRIKATFKEKITRQDRANDHECNGEGTLEAFHRELFRQQIRFDFPDFSGQVQCDWKNTAPEFLKSPLNNPRLSMPKPPFSA
jgi:hypothetical protein